MDQAKKEQEKDSNMAVNREDSVTNEIKSLESSIRDAMHCDLYISPTACIFKTPTILKSQNEKAYIPRAFSFGPYHHSNPNLKATEKIKGKYLGDLLSRFPDTKLSNIINSIEDVEKEARACYAEPINYSPDEFVKILVMDGCFIIELLRKLDCEELRQKDDPVITVASISSFLGHDLALLENQVPWMVLDLLFNLTTVSRDKKPLIKLVLEFFGHSFLSSIPPLTYHSPLTCHSKKDIKHILDLLRKWLVSSIGEEEERTSTRKHMPSATHLIETGIKFSRRITSKSIVDTKSSGEEEERKFNWEFMPSATHLTEAGIKFTRGGTSKSILDIKFADGVLEIPSLLVHDTTETFFRNLISFEQCYPDCETRFTSYAFLLDNLINTTKDLEILCDNDIIRNWVDPEAATLFFNQLCHNTSFDEFCYENLCLQVRGHCRRHWPRWRAVLVRKYFNTPWSVLSISAAVILLIMTFLQTLALFVKAF